MLDRILYLQFQKSDIVLCAQKLYNLRVNYAKANFILSIFVNL